MMKDKHEEAEFGEDYFEDMTSLFKKIPFETQRDADLMKKRFKLSSTCKLEIAASEGAKAKHSVHNDAGVKSAEELEALAAKEIEDRIIAANKADQDKAIKAHLKNQKKKLKKKQKKEEKKVKEKEEMQQL
mmetsp:Transcript_38381/g.58460  ORF Transcript_38381/g.58460 Transcript_38381/m.58460 type:complete len:131 (+) Transcript_38381:34-426(+)